MPNTFDRRFQLPRGSSCAYGGPGWAASLLEEPLPDFELADLSRDPQCLRAEKRLHTYQDRQKREREREDYRGHLASADVRDVHDREHHELSLIHISEPTRLGM